MSAVRYELGFYILEDDIPHSHRRENLKSYISSYQFMKGPPRYLRLRIFL
jgi:hypothetical protein